MALPVTLDAIRTSRVLTLRHTVAPLFLALSLALIVSSCTGLADEDSDDGVPDTLVISFTPEADPVHLELDAEGLAGYLADELGIPVEAQVDADYAATVEAMGAGHAHIATNLAPLQAAIAVERAGAELILVEERDGQASYRSEFWVLADSDIQSLEDLEERRVAFNDPLSGSGFLMPVDALIDAGLIEHGDDINDFFERVYFAGGTELSIQAAAGRMTEEGVSCLPVMREGRLVGIVTDRDLAIRVLAEQADPEGVTAENVMSEDLCTANHAAGFYEAAEMMSENGVRRLPVCDDDGNLVGIITADDLTELLADEQQQLAGVVRAQRPPY